jgi:hypothetical protein
VAARQEDGVVEKLLANWAGDVLLHRVTECCPVSLSAAALVRWAKRVLLTGGVKVVDL